MNDEIHPPHFKVRDMSVTFPHLFTLSGVIFFIIYRITSVQTSVKRADRIVPMMGGGRGMMKPGSGKRLVADASSFDDHNYKNQVQLLDDFGYEEKKPECKMVKVCSKKKPEPAVKYTSQKIYWDIY